jgi:hypothetical protein
MEQTMDESDDEETPIWILDPDSWWVKLFGPYAAFVRYMVAFMLTVSVFQVVVRIPQWVSKAVNPPPPPAAASSYDTSSSAGRIDQQLSAAHEQLAKEIARAEAELNERKLALAKLRADVDSMALTPAQRVLLGRGPSHAPTLTFIQWAKDKNVYYGIAINFIMTWFFYWLGLRASRKKAT